MLSQSNFKHSKPIERPTLLSAMTAFFDVTHMGCSKCTSWLQSGLLEHNGVLFVDVCVDKGIVMATYDPASINPNELGQIIVTIGKQVCRYYHAELIGNTAALVVDVPQEMALVR